MGKVSDVIMVVAISRNGIIAEGPTDSVNWAPWGDKASFRDITYRVKNVLVGRRTYDSMRGYEKIFNEGGREWYVLTRNLSYETGYDCVKTIEGDSAEEILSKLSGEGINEVVIAGGPEVYELFRNSLTEAYITIAEIDLSSGDVHDWVLELTKGVTPEAHYEANSEKSKPSGDRYHVEISSY